MCAQWGIVYMINLHFANIMGQHSGTFKIRQEPRHMSALEFFIAHLHNIIHIHNNVMWDWQYSTEYFYIFPSSEVNTTFGVFSINYYLELRNAITFWNKNVFLPKKGQLSCLDIVVHEIFSPK